MEKASLLSEIESVFSFVEMPSRCDMVPASPRTIESEEIQEDMEEFRGKPISGDAIRTIQRYFPVLSEKATRWILPHFLRYCLAPDTVLDRRRQIESLIYALSPETEFSVDAMKKFSLLSGSQILCLVHFLEWCLEDPYWMQAYSERIHSGVAFLGTLPARGHGGGYGVSADKVTRTEQ